MDKIRIRGNHGPKLNGEVRISGAKNAVLPAIAAGLLTSEEIRLDNVPLVTDVKTILTLVGELGAEGSLEGNRVSLRVERLRSDEASYELVRAMRASILVLGRSGRASCRERV